MKHKTIQGDCLKVMKTLKGNSVGLIYLDPPFFTQKIQRLKTRDRTTEFSFNDLWACHEDYAKFIYTRVMEMHRVLSENGSLFFHCDKNASHIIRSILDSIFSTQNFRSEIIWYYKRWSNSKKGLLPAHQTIYYYTKSSDFIFNTIYNGYSESTNVDQILQKRCRDKHGKSVYARDQNGDVVLDDEKKGVPLSDVWEIPYLNPKAKERTGYPTQKPILLLEKIIQIATEEGDLVLDPFCGSGTTLVAAKLLGRNAIGIDLSKEAIELTKNRVENPHKTESALLEKGRDSYVNVDQEALKLLQGLKTIPVQRNKGIDAILKEQYEGTPVLVRVQKKNEPLLEAASLLSKAAKRKGSKIAFLVKTENNDLFTAKITPKNIIIIDSPALDIKKQIKDRLTNQLSGQQEALRFS